MRKDLDEQLERALENVNEDRDVTKRLLNDLINYISVSNERHVEAGARGLTSKSLRLQGSFRGPQQTKDQKDYQKKKRTTCLS